jgi:hypothetical protein
MGIRGSRSCLCLSLLASFWASVAAATDPGALPLEGEIGLTLSPRSVSAIPIDEGALAQAVCGEWEEESVKAKCLVVVTNTPTGKLGSGEFALAEPVTTICGLWDATLTLAPPHVLQDSMVLREVPDDPGRGVFAGVFAMYTNLHLTNRETGRTADLTLRFGYSLAGPFVTSLEDPAASGNLILLADRVDGQLVSFEECIPPLFVKENPDYEVMAGACKICVVPSTLPAGPLAESSGGEG